MAAGGGRGGRTQPLLESLGSSGSGGLLLPPFAEAWGLLKAALLGLLLKEESGALLDASGRPAASGAALLAAKRRLRPLLDWCEAAGRSAAAAGKRR